MPRTTVIVIGAGHAGLAMSRCLSARAIDHVVLERGEVAQAWRAGRWDSLRLLTPNWQRRLPGAAADGADPDGFATMPEVIAFIEGYARQIAAPVQARTEVKAVWRSDAGFVVSTDRAAWHGRSVVLASGACGLASIPKAAAALPPSVASLTPLQYRNPGQLDQGGVLVVGASATGIQLASEIHASGRPVTLAVGEHIRAPRIYRDRDIQWWMDASGILDQRYDEVDDIERARRVPSLQLVGARSPAMLDLNHLTERGIRLVGRLAGIGDGRLQFSGSLANQCALSDLKLGRLLDSFDGWAAAQGLDRAVGAPERFAPTRVEARPPLALDLGRAGIRTVIWATGFRPDHGWLDPAWLDRKGRLRHDGGVTAVPGLYLIGMPFLRRRKSALIDGAGADAHDLATHLAAWLDGRSAPGRDAA
jgi:putative flavoprotein involved in K+ transport